MKTQLIGDVELKHSPAPWTVNSKGEIESATGDLIAQLYDNPDDGRDPAGEEQSDYNQALIVQAPLLLQSALSVLKNNGGTIAAARTIDGIEYVMVRRQDLDDLAAIIMKGTL